MSLTRRSEIIEKLLRAVVQAQGGSAIVDLSKVGPEEVLLLERVEGDSWQMQVVPRLEGRKRLRESRPALLELTP